jgi:hypothetical protein
LYIFTLIKIISGFISHRFNTPAFVIEAMCVCCEVETESFYDKQINISLYVMHRKPTLHWVSLMYLLLMRLLHVSAPTCHPQGESLSLWVREN